MIKRRLPYYLRTIVLKSKAATYGVLDAWGLLNYAKNKEKEQNEALYHRYDVANIGFSTAFSTKTAGVTGCRATIALMRSNSPGCFFIATIVALAPRQRL